MEKVSGRLYVCSMIIVFSLDQILRMLVSPGWLWFYVYLTAAITGFVCAYRIAKNGVK